MADCCILSYFLSGCDVVVAFPDLSSSTLETASSLAGGAPHSPQYCINSAILGPRSENAHEDKRQDRRGPEEGATETDGASLATWQQQEATRAMARAEAGRQQRRCLADRAGKSPENGLARSPVGKTSSLVLVKQILSVVVRC